VDTPTKVPVCEAVCGTSSGICTGVFKKSICFDGMHFLLWFRCTHKIGVNITHYNPQGEKFTQINTPPSVGKNVAVEGCVTT
jgi:hypothetical protein